MSRQLDREVILAYVNEAKGYLPAIRSNLEQYRHTPNDTGLLEEAYRHIHTIKGASSMVGFALLSHMAYLVEDTLEEIAAGQMAMVDNVAHALLFTLEQIEAYLDGIVSGHLEDESLVRSVTTVFRRLRNLPEEGDEKSIRALLSNQSKPQAKADKMPLPLPEVSAHISKDLQKTFRLEAEEHLEEMARSLTRLQKHPESAMDLQGIRRHIHTLKGSAGLVGFDEITHLSHRCEDLLDLIVDQPMDQPTLMLLQDTCDLLSDMTLELPLSGRTNKRLQDVYARYDHLLETRQSGGPVPLPLQPDPTSNSSQEDELPTASEDKESVEAPLNPKHGGGDFLRVPQKRLDDLVQTVSDLMINRNTFEQHLQKLGNQALELKPSIRRLQRIAANIEREYEVALLDVGRVARGAPVGGNTSAVLAEFDALEFDRYTEFHLLARDLTETTHDLQTLSVAIRDVLADFDGYLLRSSRLTSEAQDQLMKLRMVPLSTLTVRLQRTVRVTANQSQKNVALRIEGEGIELDKAVLEEIAEPLLHILRNAVDHGIEPPQVRQALGKKAQGIITLKAFHAGTQVVLQISDDGSGMSMDALRMKAVAGGFVSESEVENLNDEALCELAFKPGFSTAGQVSEVSGRGVGLDIVKAVVQRLKGQVELSNRSGGGMTVTIRLPLTLAILKVILVRANDQIFALPLSSITQILQPEREQIESSDSHQMLRFDGQFIPLMDLQACLGMAKPADSQNNQRPVLLINMGNQQVGIFVDKLLEPREVVVKNLGRHLTGVQGVTGATLMGDGSVVLILNPIDIAKPRAALPATPKAVSGKTAQRQIMVVDDSVSVRKVISHLLKSSGYSVLTANDGLEALETLQSSPQLPGALILDIEMPRMDGYELTRLLRGQPRFKDLPILILTSRGGSKHRNRAKDLGVTDYLVKPFRPEVLLNLLQVHSGQVS